jgi:hypothetical protein
VRMTKEKQYMILGGYRCHRSAGRIQPWPVCFLEISQCRQMWQHHDNTIYFLDPSRSSHLRPVPLIPRSPRRPLLVGRRTPRYRQVRT